MERQTKQKAKLTAQKLQTLILQSNSGNNNTRYFERGFKNNVQSRHQLSSTHEAVVAADQVIW